LKFKKLISFFISFSLLTNMFISSSIKVTAATISRVYYSLDNSTIEIGQTFNIYVKCESINDLYGTSVDFKYDPTMFQVLDITEGDVFKVSGKPYNTVVKTPILPDTTGTISMGLAFQGKVTGFNGTGNLFIIKAKALKIGTFNLKTTDDISQFGTNGFNMCVKLGDGTNGVKIAGVTYQDSSFNLTDIIPVVKPPSVSYQGHVQNIGWQPLVKDGALAGTEGQSLRVEGFKIKLQDTPAGLKIKYRTHVQNIGWQNWVYDGALGGTEGKALRVEALQIVLEGTDAEKYTVQYQAHVQSVGWQPWATDGEVAGTSGKSLRIEAIRIKIAKIPTVSYQGHVQNIGWQPWVINGALAGTEGQALRVEAFKLKIYNAPAGLNIKYRTHVQNIGWQDWVYNGAMAGTQGLAFRIEAMQIVLEGTNADKYSVQYQAHVQSVGWQPWVSDGQTAGTSGKSLRVEALRIRIIPK